MADRESDPEIMSDDLDNSDSVESDTESDEIIEENKTRKRKKIKVSGKVFRGNVTSKRTGIHFHNRKKCPCKAGL